MVSTLLGICPNLFPDFYTSKNQANARSLKSKNEDFCCDIHLADILCLPHLEVSSGGPPRAGWFISNELKNHFKKKHNLKVPSVKSLLFQFIINRLTVTIGNLSLVTAHLSYWSPALASVAAATLRAATPARGRRPGAACAAVLQRSRGALAQGGRGA